VVVALDRVERDADTVLNQRVSHYAGLFEGHGLVAIPRSSNPERLPASLDIFDSSLTEEVIAAMWALDHTGGRSHRFRRDRALTESLGGVLNFAQGRAAWR
jgi:hypothetical protein